MAAPLARWRQVRARRDAGLPPDPDDAAWLADRCLDMVERGTPPRVVFGLPARGGAGSLSHVAALVRRDALLRELHRLHCPHLAARPAARAMLALVRHPARCGEEIARLLAELGTCGELPAERQLARLLRDIPTPPLNVPAGVFQHRR